MVQEELVETPYDLVVIGRAEKTDLEAILAVFDDAVAWMVAQGNSKQWGATPFSASPRMVERFRDHLESDETFVAAKGGVIVGAIVITFKPPKYCWTEDPGASAAYVEPFATSPSVRGQGVGRLLLARATRYASEREKPLLRLDCFAENMKLPAYYESAGFEPRGDFTVGDWHGRMFERNVSN